MAKKLSEDQIKWILSVDSTEAQQGIHELTKKNRELELANKERRQEMIKLEMQGKKETAAYRNLSAEVKKNNATLSANRSIIKGLEGQIGLTEKTMAQLKKEARALQRQLDNTSKSLNPEQYSALEKELNGVRKRMSELNTESKNANKSMGWLITARGTLAAFFGGMLTKSVAMLSNMVKKAGEFIAQSVEIAAKAQGIDHAFNRIANKDYLKSLREQTKGLISDFTLMQSAVRAENFDIPLSQLGTLLEFAQNRARDTGESVDYLVESIVNGIGRKSPLILDNLGISTVRLQEEVKKTGDFASAVGKIINEEMAKAGPVIDTAADAAQRKKVAWENLQLATGKFFVGFRKGWDDFTTRFTEGLTKMISGQEKATKQFDDQVKKVAELESSVIPLIARYETLKDKTKLTKEEQEELTRTLNAIASTVPGVVTEFDRYGNALSVNTQKVWAFIEAEKAKLKYMHRDAIKEVEKDIKKTEQEITLLQNRINKGTYSQSVGGSVTGYSQSVEVEFSDEDKQEMKRQLAEKEGILTDHQEKLKFLDGTSLEEQVKVQKAGIDKRKEFNELSQKELEAYIENYAEHKDKFIEIAREVYNHRFAVGSDDGDGKDKPKGKPKSELDKEEYDKSIKELEAYIAREKALIQQKYMEGQITERMYQVELEQLEQTKLQKTLEISGISFEQQKEIELKIFEFKKSMLLQIEENERAHQERMAKLREDAERARAENNWKTLKEIAKQNEKNWEEQKKREIQRRQEIEQIGYDFGDQMGQVLGDFMSSNEEMQRNAARNMLLVAIDTLETVVKMSVAEAVARAVASSSNPVTAALKATLMTGMITAAFAGVKSMVKSKADAVGSESSSSGSTSTTRRVVDQRAAGKYDVIGADDGRRYSVPYLGPAQTGIIPTPALVGEYGPELIISAPDFSRLQRHMNYPLVLRAIQESRVPQRAEGNYTSIPPAPVNAPQSGLDNALLIELIRLLSDLHRKGVKASVNYHEFERTQNTINRIRDRARR